MRLSAASRCYTGMLHNGLQNAYSHPPRGQPILLAPQAGTRPLPRDRRQGRGLALARDIESEARHLVLHRRLRGTRGSCGRPSWSPINPDFPDPETDEPFETLTHKQAEALAGRAYADFYAARSDNPGPVWDREKAVESHQRRGQRVAPGQHKLYAYWQDITESAENRRLDEDSLRRFAVSYYQARGDAEQRLLEHAKGNYDERLQPMRFAKPERPKIGAVDAFERYADAQKLKPKTKKRWRPVIDLLIAHLGHDDLRKLTKLELITWKNKLLKEKKSDEFVRVPRTVRDVHLAVVRATCQFLVDELELDEKTRRRHRGAWRRGRQGRTTTTSDSLTKTLRPFSARPWYRVRSRCRPKWRPHTAGCPGSAPTPAPASTKSRRSVRRTSSPRTVCAAFRPKGSHKDIQGAYHSAASASTEQGLADYVEVRAQARKALCSTIPGQGATRKSRQSAVREGRGSLGDWVRLMHVDHDVWPNHGWRHRWKSQARHVGMHPEIADFITGHGGGSVSKKYGDHWGHVRPGNREAAALRTLGIHRRQAHSAPAPCESRQRR